MALANFPLCWNNIDLGCFSLHCRLPCYLSFQPSELVHAMSSTLSDTLQSASAHARSGNLAEAEKLCENLLARPTVEPEARHLLGVIRNIQLRYAEAEPLLRQAVAEQPA